MNGQTGKKIIIIIVKAKKILSRVQLYSKECALTCIPLTLQFVHGIRINVFEAPGRNTNSDAAFIAREMSL